LDYNRWPFLSSSMSCTYELNLGSHIWSRAIRGSGNQWVYDIDLQSGSYLCMAGSFEGYMEIGGDILGSYGGLDAY